MPSHPTPPKAARDPDIESTDVDFFDDEAGVDPLARPVVEIGREDDAADERLSAEQDVASDTDELSARAFDDPPGEAALDFDDGTDMGHPRGNTAREGGTWAAQGADSGELKPPAEIQSDRIGPGEPRERRQR